jgi:hypothetical protein
MEPQPVTPGRSSRSWLVRWLLLGLAVAGVHLVIATSMPRENEQIVRYLRGVRRDGTDVLLLGDSVTLTTSYSDRDTRSLGDMVRARLPSCATAVAAGSSYHTELYEQIGRFMIAGARPPKVVVVPINLRTFTTSAIFHPGWRRSLLQRMLRADSLLYEAASRPLEVFKWYEKTEGSVDEYFAAPVYDGDRAVSTIGRLGVIGRDLGYIEPGTPGMVRSAVLMHYLQRITAADERVQAAVRLARALRGAGIKSVFYLTPVDWMASSSILGPRVTERLRENAGTISDVLAREQVQVRDWSALMDDAVFSWRTYPNEHLKEAGRLRLAERVASAVCEELGAGSCCGS